MFRNITADIHIDSGMTQYDTATSRMFLKVTLQKSINTPDTNTRKHCMIHSLSQQHMKMKNLHNIHFDGLLTFLFIKSKLL